MNVQQKASCVFLIILCGMLAVYPTSPAISCSLVAITLLFGFTLWIERKKQDDLDEVKSQIKELKGKVDNIILGKGFGR